MEGQGVSVNWLLLGYECDSVWGLQGQNLAPTMTTYTQQYFPKVQWKPVTCHPVTLRGPGVQTPEYTVTINPKGVNRGSKRARTSQHHNTHGEWLHTGQQP